MKPALTPEEWAAASVEFAGELGKARVWDQRSDRPMEVSAIGLAALALAGAGPGGGPLFTWEDVDMIREYQIEVLGYDPDTGDREEYEFAERLAALADRIASLLPPRVP